LDFILNDLSFHGQFPDIVTFKNAVNCVMTIRQKSLISGRAVYCHKGIINAQVTPTMIMPQAIQALTLEERRALLQWITQQGPYWDDARNHQPDDWLECNGKVVTDTAVGEAGWCCLNGLDRGLISLAPSDWCFSPVPVEFVSDGGSKDGVDVLNYWDSVAFEAMLQSAPVPIGSWGQMEALARARYTQITFSPTAFSPLEGYPFFLSAAHRIIFILDILNRFKSCFDANGQRTPEGHQLYQDFFTGQSGDGGRGALFCDSSDDEKNEFKTEMTFVHPGDASETIFCTWHGKVQTPQLRVHFSSPIRANDPLYIVYIGPKITKR
jgi:hypothetical protein